MRDQAESEAVYAEWMAAFERALANGTFVKLTLGKGRDGDLRQAFGRVVTIQGQPHLSFVFRHDTRDVTTNYAMSEAGRQVRNLLGARFGNAHLFTTELDLELLSNRRGEPRLSKHKARFAAPPPPDHDRPKRYVLDPRRAPYLRELGIVTEEGRVRSDKADKYRQLQNLIKILDELREKSALSQKARLRVMDMGCGKGYLTFALHDYFNHHLEIETEVIGIDRNPELMSLCNGVAQKLEYKGLEFRAGDLETMDAAEIGNLDVLLALHACDTATDDALFKGMVAGASIIMTVPCCQKELRPQFRSPPEEQPLFKHDTYKDRFSQMLTDALRGLLLESQGYRSRVAEFISDAHTHRNVMVAGVLDPDYKVRGQRLAEINALEARYRITSQRLQTLLRDSGRLAEMA